MADAVDASKDAQVLCGDAIANYKTVQSFGHEDRLVKLYEDLLKNEQSKVARQELCFAVTHGWTQSNTYLVLGALFFFGGLLVHVTKDDGEDAISPL